MLLSYRKDTFEVPHTSKCSIHTKGVINDGDVVTISSPVFGSIDFASRAINLSNTFTVIARVSDKSITNDSVLEGTLVCDDNNVFDMYVRI